MQALKKKKNDHRSSLYPECVQDTKEINDFHFKNQLNKYLIFTLDNFEKPQCPK